MKAAGRANDPRQPRIVAAIPAYNEGIAVVQVVLGARAHADKVIVIDDGSSDHTARFAAGAGAEVVQHPVNRGKAAAITTACRAAVRERADILVLLDGDGQHNPQEIPLLLAPIQRGAADVVIGSRFLDVRNPTPYYRTIGQRVLNVATHLGSGLACSDSQSGFRALSRRVYPALELRETFLHGLGGESEMQFQLAELDARLADVPIYVSYDERARRSPLKHGFGVLYRVLVLTARSRGRQVRRAFRPATAGAERVRNAKR